MSKKGRGSLKGILIGLVLIALVAGYYFYLSNRKPKEAAEDTETTVSVAQQLLLKNIDDDYPPTPREVLKLYSDITVCFYSEEYTDEELTQLALQIEKLYDEELIAKLRRGEDEVTDYILEKYKPLVRKRTNAMYLMGGETEDLIQEGMIGLIKAVRDYDPDQGASFASFAELCVSRQMYSAIEASKRKKHIPLNSYVSLYDDSGQEGEERRTPLIDTIEPIRDNDPEVLYLGKKFTEVFIEQLKDTLSPLENHVLYLHLMGTDYRTIAELLGKSPKSIDNALQRIKAKAEKMLDKSE